MDESRKVRVFFFGASAVSAAAVTFAKPLGFEIIVMDNEQEKLDNPAFDGCEKLVVDFEDLGDLGITEDDMLCVITRGHRFDRPAYAYALKTPAFYIGMMGSAKKNAKCFEYALEHGCTQEQIDASFAPIGIGLTCSDAVEIGLDIAAQLMQKRNERWPRELDHESLHAD